MNGALIIFYRRHNDRDEFLLVQNAKTGNVGFVGGAQEDGESLQETAQREIKEELGLDSDKYILTPTDVVYEFVFGNNKPEREGQRGLYHVFLSDGSSLGDIPYTSELKIVAWKSKEDILKELTFADLKDVFVDALDRIRK